MASLLKFQMVVWSVDKGGRRYPSALPVMFKLRTPIRDFRGPTQGFPQGLFLVWASECEQVVRMTIADKGGPSGRWESLSTKEPPKGGYAAQKAKKYPGMQILVASGDMIQSFFGGADHVFDQTAMGMKWGTNNPLAGYHQRGHESPTRLPQRRLWDPDAGFAQTLQSDAVRYCNEAYRQEGFHMAKESGASVTRVEASQLGYMGINGGYGASLSQ